MKKLDLNNYGVLEMNAEEMRVTEGGWMLFGTQTKQGLAFITSDGQLGYNTTTTTYIFGIAVSTTTGSVLV